MDFTKMLDALRLEHRHVTEAILSLEKLDASRRSGGRTGGEKRGRPLGSKNKRANLLMLPIPLAS